MKVVGNYLLLLCQWKSVGFLTREFAYPHVEDSIPTIFNLLRYWKSFRGGGGWVYCVYENFLLDELYFLNLTLNGGKLLRTYCLLHALQRTTRTSPEDLQVKRLLVLYVLPETLDVILLPSDQWHAERLLSVEGWSKEDLPAGLNKAPYFCKSENYTSYTPISGTPLPMT